MPTLICVSNSTQIWGQKWIPYQTSSQNELTTLSISSIIYQMCMAANNSLWCLYEEAWDNGWTIGGSLETSRCHSKKGAAGAILHMTYIQKTEHQNFLMPATQLFVMSFWYAGLPTSSRLCQCQIISTLFLAADHKPVTKFEVKLTPREYCLSFQYLAYGIPCRDQYHRSCLSIFWSWIFNDWVQPQNQSGRLFSIIR